MNNIKVVSQLVFSALFLAITSLALAQTKVVVVPLGADEPNVSELATEISSRFVIEPNMSACTGVVCRDTPVSFRCPASTVMVGIDLPELSEFGDAAVGVCDNGSVNDRDNVSFQCCELMITVTE